MTDSISPISTSATGFASELAALLLEIESVQSDSASLARDQARSEFMAESEHQVAELHDAADATLVGAFLGASFTVAGAAFDAASACQQYDADSNNAVLAGYGSQPANCDLTKVVGLKLDAALNTKLSGEDAAWGKGFSGTAGLAKAVFGDSVSANDSANAKRYEVEAEQAKWAAGDASDAIGRVSRLGDKILETLQQINQDQNSSNNALIGRI